MKEMNIKDSTEVLSKRSNFAFPAAFGAFCHSLSGGLPRDLRRVARKLTRENAKVKADPDTYQQTPVSPAVGEPARFVAAGR